MARFNGDILDTVGPAQANASALVSSTSDEEIVKPVSADEVLSYPFVFIIIIKRIFLDEIAPEKVPFLIESVVEPFSHMLDFSRIVDGYSRFHISGSADMKYPRKGVTNVIIAEKIMEIAVGVRFKPEVSCRQALIFLKNFCSVSEGIVTMNPGWKGYLKYNCTETVYCPHKKLEFGYNRAGDKNCLWADIRCAREYVASKRLLTPDKVNSDYRESYEKIMIFCSAVTGHYDERELSTALMSLKRKK